MQENLLIILINELGEEQFEIVNAAYNIHQSEDEIWEFIIVFETGKSLKRIQELEEIIDAQANFEASIVLKKNQIEITKNKVFLQTSGYDEKRDENLTNFYYFAHYSIENIEVQKNWIKAELKAETTVNNYVRGKPDAQLIITTTKFFLNKGLERSFS